MGWGWTGNRGESKHDKSKEYTSINWTDLAARIKELENNKIPFEILELLVNTLLVDTNTLFEKIIKYFKEFFMTSM